MKSFLNTCNLLIYHDINFNVHTFTDPMPEKNVRLATLAK